MDKKQVQKATEVKAGFEVAIHNITKTDPWVPIQLDGVEFRMEFRFKAVRALFQMTGKNMNAGELQAEDFQSFESMAQVLTIGLSRNHPDLTQDMLEDMLNMRHRAYYLWCIQQAIEATQPDLSFITQMVGEMPEKVEGEEGQELSTDPLEATLPLPTSGELVEV